jgi:hypothetical protein
MKECDATSANMITYRATYDKLKGNFEGCKVMHIGHKSNEEADSLANIGTKFFPIPPCIFFEEISKQSIKIKLAASKPALATCPGAASTQNGVAVVQHGVGGPTDILIDI